MVFKGSLKKTAVPKELRLKVSSLSCVESDLGNMIVFVKGKVLSKKMINHGDNIFKQLK